MKLHPASPSTSLKIWNLLHPKAKLGPENAQQINIGLKEKDMSRQGSNTIGVLALQ